MLGVVLGMTASLGKVNSVYIQAMDSCVLLRASTLGNERTTSALNIRSSRLHTSERKCSQMRQHNRQSAL